MGNTQPFTVQKRIHKILLAESKRAPDTGPDPTNLNKSKKPEHRFYCLQKKSENLKPWGSGRGSPRKSRSGAAFPPRHSKQITNVISGFQKLFLDLEIPDPIQKIRPRKN
jgi:hypothetical protein